LGSEKAKYFLRRGLTGIPNGDPTGKSVAVARGHTRKQLIYLAGADAAGVVLGARVPIILTSRSDSLKVRLASAAVAKLAAERRKTNVSLP
jgi:hypothetical protein